jgi:tetratricopeptide (TPR) repeat protein
MPRTPLAPLPLPMPAGTTSGREAKLKLLRRLLPAALVAAGLAIGLYFWLRPQPVPPGLPALDLSKGDPEIIEAISKARQEVIRKPDSGAAWGKLGMVLRAHEFGEEAVQCFAQAESLDPVEPRWPYLEGLSLLDSGEPEKATDCLRRAVERCTEQHPVVPLLKLAEVLLDMGPADEAEALLKKAAQRDPHNARAQLDLGRVAYGRGDNVAALEHLAAAMNDSQTRRRALRLRVLVYSRTGKPDLAKIDDAQAGDAAEDERWIDPFDEETFKLQCGLGARLKAADMLRRTGQLNQAVILLEETARKYPMSELAWIHLAEIWHTLKRIDQAETACRKAVEINADSTQGWFWLGVFQSMQNRPEEAIESLRRALALKSDHAIAHYNLGICLLKMNNPEAAAAEFRTTLRLRPGYEPAQNYLRQIEAWQKSKKK